MCSHEDKGLGLSPAVFSSLLSPVPVDKLQDIGRRDRRAAVEDNSFPTESEGVYENSVSEPILGINPFPDGRSYIFVELRLTESLPR